jgi:superfamily II DNA or RNA helicase
MNMPLPYKLRDFQVKAVETFLHRGKGVIVAPTGSGKTAIAVECMFRLGNPRTAILVPKIPLMEQWIKFLAKCGVYATRFYGQEKRLGRVTVFIFNSAVKHLRELSYYDFIIVDEVHWLGAEKFSSILDVIRRCKWALGITSHVERADGMHIKILSVMPIIYRMIIGDAARKGFISKLIIQPYPVSMTIREAMLYNEYTETIRQCMRILRADSITEIQNYAKEGNMYALQVLKYIQLRKSLLTSIAAKQHALLDVINRHKNEMILVFGESIDSIETIYKFLTRLGVRCGKYHSEMDLNDRAKTLQTWGKTFRVLLSVRCLEEGIDVPQVRVGAILCSGLHDRQWIQRVGRLLRPRPDGSPGIVYIIYCKGTIEEKYLPTIIRLMRGALIV